MNRLQNSLEACTSKENRSYLEAAGRAAVTAGSIIRELYDKPHSIEMKGAIDLVTEADVASETAVIASLNEDTPGIVIMAEESFQGDLEGTEGLSWVIDPLDGTTNFAHGVPIFGVSIALLHDGQPVVGVIYCPMQDELFCASAGGGAWLNDHLMTVTETDFLVQALVATGFPYNIHERLPTVVSQVENVLPKVRDIRRMGAAAVDLAYVACGRLDGFWEMDLKPWDTAAGWLLVLEAGGKVTDFSGKEFSPFKPEIVATNSALHNSLLELI